MFTTHTAAAEGLRPKSQITAAWLREAGVTEPARFVKTLIDWSQVLGSERRRHPATKVWTVYYSAAGIAKELADLGYDKRRLQVLREMSTDPAWRTAEPRAVRLEVMRRR